MNSETSDTIGNSDNTKRFNLLIIILALITAAAIGVSIWAIWFRTTEAPLAPDYAPQETDPNARPIEKDDASKLEMPEGGGALSLTYTTKVMMDLSEKKARLMFGNPATSTQDIVLQIVIRDRVVVQSGRITPGNMVTALDLRDDAGNLLLDGGYDGKFVVLAYSHDSGEKSMVTTEIPLTITVVE